MFLVGWNGARMFQGLGVVLSVVIITTVGAGVFYVAVRGCHFLTGTKTHDFFVGTPRRNASRVVPFRLRSLSRDSLSDTPFVALKPSSVAVPFHSGNFSSLYEWGVLRDECRAGLSTEITARGYCASLRRFVHLSGIDLGLELACNGSLSDGARLWEKVWSLKFSGVTMNQSVIVRDQFNYNYPQTVDELLPKGTVQARSLFDNLFKRLATSHPSGLSPVSLVYKNDYPLWHDEMRRYDVWKDPVMEAPDQSLLKDWNQKFSRAYARPYCTHVASKVRGAPCVVKRLDEPGTLCDVPIVCGQLGWSNCWDDEIDSEKTLGLIGKDGVVLVTLRGDGPIPLMRRSAGVRKWFTHGAWGLPRSGFNPAVHFNDVYALPIGRKRGAERKASTAAFRLGDSASTGRRLLLVNVGALWRDRKSLLACAETLSFATVLRPALVRGMMERSGLDDTSKDLAWLYLLSRFQFVLSPPGNGWDCYRTWDALYAGAIPILQRAPGQPVDELYRDLPVLIVDAYADITRHLLEDTWSKFRTQRFDIAKLTATYWSNRVRAAANCTPLYPIRSA